MTDPGADAEGTPFEVSFAAALEKFGGDTGRAQSLGQRIAEEAASLPQPRTPGELLIAVLSRLPQSSIASATEHPRRRVLHYEVNHSRSRSDLAFTAQFDGRFCIAPEASLEIVEKANASLLALEQFTRALRVPLTELVGMRTVSVLVSAVVVSEAAAVLAGEVFPNPHQDGYPDLLPHTAECVAYQEEVRVAGRWSDKAAWTNAGFGGIEVKATNGNTPPASKAPKPGLGDERSALIRSFDWKAHHRETQRLLGVTWDFVDRIPTISACFWRNDLEIGDWGAVVKPRENGGRTTSVSVMGRSGLNKMAQGWMVRVDDPALAGALKRARLHAWCPQCATPHASDVRRF